MRHILSILVENQSGVLSRVAGLFSRRGFNIDSLSVGKTENENYSRITIATTGDDMVVTQISRQVEKLIDVVEVVELLPEESVYRELTLIKISADKQTRTELVGIVEIFRANIIDVSNSTITVEITGDKSKVDAFKELVEPYGIKEIATTGITGLQRGNKFINDMKKFEEE